MTFPLPKLPTSELVGSAWLAAIPGFTAAMTGPKLPSQDSDWARSGFLRVTVVGGAPNIYLPVKWPVFQVDCFATIPGSNDPPWAKATGLAEIVRAACLSRTSMRQPLALSAEGVPHGHAVVQSAYLLTEPRRTYADVAGYAVCTFDLQMSWVTVADTGTT